MRIGIDAHVLGKGIGGVERVVDQIVRRVPALMPDDDFFVFTNRRFAPPAPAPQNVTWIRLPFSDPLIQRTVLLPYLARRHRLDLLHVQRIMPPLAGCPVIAHIHDILPLTHPHEHPGFRNALVRSLLPSTIRHSARVLTVSASAAAEISRRYPDAAGKIATAPNGIDHALFKPSVASSETPPVVVRFGLEGKPYALYVGAITPRKNLEVLLEAFHLFALQHPDARLVIAGMVRGGGYADTLRRLVEVLGLAAQVCFTGFLRDEDCVGLLQHAHLFLAPSIGEGFDLPPLEAMACGIPVVASDIDVHRELLGEACLHFDPADKAALAAALARGWFDLSLRSGLTAAGLLLAARFSWENAAQLVARLYRETATPSTTRSDRP